MIEPLNVFAIYFVGVIATAAVIAIHNRAVARGYDKIHPGICAFSWFGVIVTLIYALVSLFNGDYKITAMDGKFGKVIRKIFNY